MNVIKEQLELNTITDNFFQNSEQYRQKIAETDLNKNIYILGIDPGTYTGIALLEVSSVNKLCDTISIKGTWLLCLNSVDYITPLSDKMNKLKYLLNTIEKIFQTIDISVVVCEEGYVGKFVSIIISLENYTSVLEYNITKEYGIPFIRIHNKNVKMIIKQELEQEGITLLPTNVKEMCKLWLNKKFNISNISEHECDAISIGYAYLKQTI